jgi:hypothetical protein
MRLFRSEEHVRRGLRRAGRDLPGWTALAARARLWYGDRLQPDWTPRSRDEHQALLDSVGLTGEFWRLA